MIDFYLNPYKTTVMPFTQGLLHWSWYTGVGTPELLHRSCYTGVATQELLHSSCCTGVATQEFVLYISSFSIYLFWRQGQPGSIYRNVASAEIVPAGCPNAWWNANWLSARATVCGDGARRTSKRRVAQWEFVLCWRNTLRRWCVPEAQTCAKPEFEMPDAIHVKGQKLR